MVPPTSIWSPAPRHLRMLRSRRHSLRVTRIIPTRLWSLTTIHAAATSALSIFLAHRSPPTAATRLPVSPTPVVKAPSPTLWAILSFFTTVQLAPGSPSGWTEAAALKASAAISPLLLRARTAGLIFAFTAIPRRPRIWLGG